MEWGGVRSPASKGNEVHTHNDGTNTDRAWTGTSGGLARAPYRNTANDAAWRPPASPSAAVSWRAPHTAAKDPRIISARPAQPAG